MPASNAQDARTKRVATIAQVYLREALETIDAELGSGAARANPALVAAFLNACAVIHGKSPQGT